MTSQNFKRDLGELGGRHQYNQYPKNKYQKEAVANFRKIDYVNSLNGHCDVASANTLLNSIKMAINYDSNYDRFKPEVRGGFFSHTHTIPSSFTKKVRYLIFQFDF
jgi:hypothetical protein